jgi:hypothetical protein
MEWLPFTIEPLESAISRLTSKFVLNDNLIFSRVLPLNSSAKNLPVSTPNLLVIERPLFALIYPCSSGVEVKVASASNLVTITLNGPGSATVFVLHTACLDLGLGAYFAQVHQFAKPVRLLHLSKGGVDISLEGELVRLSLQPSLSVMPPPSAITVTQGFSDVHSFARLKFWLPRLTPVWAETLGRTLGIRGCGWLANPATPAVASALEVVGATGEVIYPVHIYCRYIETAGPAVTPKRVQGISDVKLALTTLLNRVKCPRYPDDAAASVLADPNEGTTASRVRSRLENQIHNVIHKYPVELFQPGWPYLVKRGLEEEPDSFLALRLLPLGNDEGWPRRDTQNFVSSWLKQKIAVVGGDQGRLAELMVEVSRFVGRPNVGLLKGLKGEFAALLGDELMADVKEEFRWEYDVYFVEMQKAFIESDHVESVGYRVIK